MRLLSDTILDFYYNLQLDEALLPEGVRAMNPYQNNNEEVDRIMRIFHEKYFADKAPRQLILGINPGRHGAGLTGIPFTDSPALRKHCQIETSIETRETSSEFVYSFINAFGGPQAFYQQWFIGGVCPLGFLQLNARGNWVNWNYYDQKVLEKAVTPFIIEQISKQADFCGNPSTCLVLGTGKNYKFLKQLNEKQQWFSKVIALEHPRYIMQYKRKQKDEYSKKFVQIMQSAARP